MRVGAEADVVVSRVEHVAALVGVPGGHPANGEADLDGLGRAGRQLARLGEAAEDDGALGQAALLVRGGEVDLDDLLARRATGVGHGDGRLDVRIVGAHRVERLLEGGVGEAVAKREHHGGIVVEAGVVARGSLHRGRLVVAIAVVDALLVLHEVRGAVGAEAVGVGVVVAGDVGVVLATEVLERGVGGEVGDPGVGRLAGRTHGAHEELADAVGAGGAERADVQDGVDLVVAAHEGTELHGGGGVDEDDDLLAGGLCRGDEVLLLDGELELVLAVNVVGGLVVLGEGRGHARLDVSLEVAGEVAALAAATPEDDDRGGPGDGALGVGGVCRPGNLADVVGGRAGVVHRDGGLGVVRVVAVDEIEGGVVDREAGVGDALVEGHAVVGVNSARASAAVDGIRRIAAEEADGGPCGKRQRAVVVLEQDGTLLDDLRDDLGRRLLRLVASAVGGRVVRGVPALGTLGLDDGSRTAAQVVAQQRAVAVRGDVERPGGTKRDDRSGSLRHELPSCDGLGLLPHQILLLLFSHPLSLEGATQYHEPNPDAVPLPHFGATCRFRSVACRDLRAIGTWSANLETERAHRPTC